MQKEFNETLELLDEIKDELVEITDHNPVIDLYYLVAKINLVHLNMNEIGAALEEHNLI